MLYQVVAAEAEILSGLCGFVEFSFGQELSNCNPNELDADDELSKYKYFS